MKCLPGILCCVINLISPA